MKNQLAIYKKRRQRLMQQLPDNSIALIFSAAELERNQDVTYPFRQNSDFLYLSGFNEPEAVMVLCPGRKQGEFILFNRKRDPLHEQWEGLRAGQAGAIKDFGADAAFDIDDFPKQFAKLLKGMDHIYYPLGRADEFDQLVMEQLNLLRRQKRAGINIPSHLHDIEELVHEMRLIKDEHELAILRQSGKISAKAHCRAMKICKPGMMEYELEAELHYRFAKQGAREVAYGSIVGSGRNSCILHYRENNAQMKSGDLVLIDAGGEYQSYAADITRTFPVNGKFSRAQKQVYELVLKAQTSTIAMVRAGVNFNDLQDNVVQVLTEGLVQLGILKGRVSTLIKNKAYFPFYMHRVSHWMGLDVHDVGSYKHGKKWRTLQAGMVLTIEPGLYFCQDFCKKLDKKWNNIGVRIEDDIVVTETGCEVLTSGVPKTVAEIEALMKK